jgi:hypothetical protein
VEPLTLRRVPLLSPPLLQAARAAALLEAATITVAKLGCGSSLHTVRSSVRIPWQGSGEEGAEGGDGGCSSLPLGVVVALAHHLVGEGAQGGAEVSGATSVGLAHLSKFARARKPLCWVLTPLLMFLKRKGMAGSGEYNGRVKGFREPPRAGGGGGRPEHWRELVSSGVGGVVGGVGAGVSAVRQVSACRRVRLSL